MALHQWLEDAFPRQTELQLLTGHIVRAISDHGHGGSVWVLSSEEDRPPNIRIKYPTPGVLSMVLLQHIPEQDKRRKWAQMLGQLSAVDGPVLIDRGARVLGFGAFIDLESNFEVIRQSSFGRTATINAEEVGGGRHRAGVNFCRTTAPSLAVVVSEDGGVTLIRRPLGGETPQLFSMSVLGFEDNPHPF
jgi:hypothetical protein